MAKIRIDHLREQYEVEEPTELEARIERCDVHDHPAWENLTTRIDRLERL